MKIALRNAPKLLLVIPVVGLMGIGLQSAAQANGSSKSPVTTQNSHDMTSNSGTMQGDMGSSCDVPEPAWFTMVAAGGLPMGLQIFRRKFGKSW